MKLRSRVACDAHWPVTVCLVWRHPSEHLFQAPVALGMLLALLMQFPLPLASANGHRRAWLVLVPSSRPDPASVESRVI